MNEQNALDYGQVTALASLKKLPLFSSNKVLCCVGNMFWEIVLLQNEAPNLIDWMHFSGNRLTECFCRQMLLVSLVT